MYITHNVAASYMESTGKLIHALLKEFPQLFHYGAGIVIFSLGLVAFWGIQPQYKVIENILWTSEKKVLMLSSS